MLDSAFADAPVIGPQLQENVHSLTGSGVALAVGLGIALWAGTSVALALENALDHIWGIPFKRRANPVMARVRALFWIAIFGAIIVVGALLGSASAFTSVGPVVRVAAIALSLTLNVGVFLAVFRVLTSHRPSWRQTLPVRWSRRSRGRCCRRSACISSTAGCRRRRLPTASSRS